jgi:transcriptional regulator with XRE-family HTH domain
MINQEIFSSKVRKRMTELNLRPTQLSKMMGTTPSTISNWRNGKRAPRLHVLGDLAKCLQVDLNYFAEEAQSENHV